MMHRLYSPYVDLLRYWSLFCCVALPVWGQTLPELAVTVALPAPAVSPSAITQMPTNIPSTPANVVSPPIEPTAPASTVAPNATATISPTVPQTSGPSINSAVVSPIAIPPLNLTNSPAAVSSGVLASTSTSPSPATLPAPVLKSIFFTDMEREAIVMAKKQFLDRSTSTETEADLLDQLQGIKAAFRPEEINEQYYPQFYLQTLIYHTPKDWTLWIKDAKATKKYTPETTIPQDAPLKILAIGSESIKLQWHPKNWQYVSNTFKGGDPNIQLDSSREMVVFSLGVNQTLSSSDMKIQEGTIEPVSVVQNNAAPAKPGEPGKGVNAEGKPGDGGLSFQRDRNPSAVNPAQPQANQPTVLDLYKTVDSIDKKP